MRKVLLVIVALCCAVSVSAQTAIPDVIQAAIDHLAKVSVHGTSEELADALCKVAALDVSASLDAEGERYATQAEDIARKNNLPKQLAGSLIIKANICGYAETDKSFNRNDEGIQYALEAADAAKSAQSDSLLLEAYCIASQLYVSKNRWNDTLDPEWYSLAGKYLDMADSIAHVTPPANPAKLLAFRVRYYRQGNRIDDALAYCEKAFSGIADSDYLLRAQVYDQLTPLYIQAGKLQEAADAHSSYVHYFTLYTRSNESETIQELQTKYETELKAVQLQRKKYQILFLITLLALIAVAAVILYLRARRERLLKESAIRENSAKQELIEFMSKDRHNPVNSSVSDIERFVANAGNMNEEQIAAESKRIVEEERHLSHDVAEYVSDIVISRKQKISDLGLSQREIEIVHLSLEGLSAAQIGERLHISTRTVSNHKANIYAKMDVSSNAEMCQKAREIGI